MKPNDRRQFDMTIVALAELHGKELSKPLLNMYWEALKDIPFEDFNRAANLIVRTGKFFPKPADFREQVMAGLPIQAALAYGKVQKAFIEGGVYATVVFDDPAIHAAIDNLGGWVKFCNLTDNELKWWRKDFEKVYQGVAPLVAAGKLEPPKALPGLYALDSHATSTAKKEVYIGNKQAALEWTGANKALEADNPEGKAKVAALTDKIGGK